MQPVVLDRKSILSVVLNFCRMKSGSSKHILKHKCHVDSPIIALILLPRRSMHTVGTRGVYGSRYMKSVS